MGVAVDNRSARAGGLRGHTRQKSRRRTETIEPGPTVPSAAQWGGGRRVRGKGGKGRGSEVAARAWEGKGERGSDEDAKEEACCSVGARLSHDRIGDEVREKRGQAPSLRSPHGSRHPLLLSRTGVLLPHPSRAPRCSLLFPPAPPRAKAPPTSPSTPCGEPHGRAPSPQASLGPLPKTERSALAVGIAGAGMHTRRLGPAHARTLVATSYSVSARCAPQFVLEKRTAFVSAA